MDPQVEHLANELFGWVVRKGWFKQIVLSKADLASLPLPILLLMQSEHAKYPSQDIRYWGTLRRWYCKHHLDEPYRGVNGKAVCGICGGFTYGDV